MTFKKRINIYGDSFASDLYPNPPKNSLNWIDFLRKTASYEIKNYSAPGTNFHYSYRHFLENYQHVDRNIVLVTDWSRIMIKCLKDKQVCRYISSSGYLSLKNKKIENAVEQFYTYIYDDDFYHDIHYSMIDSMRYLDPDVILIPCFPRSVSKDIEQYSLFDISFEDFKYYGIQEERAYKILRQEEKKEVNGLQYEFKDVRRCHLTIENNEMLASKILKMLENNETIFDLSASDYRKPKNSFDFYFELVDSV